MDRPAIYGDTGAWDSGCRRRPKTRYASGAAPKELTATTATAQTHFEPRIWIAGRPLLSMSSASLSMPSATAAVMIRLRLRVLRSLHFRAAITTPPRTWHGPLMSGTLHRVRRRPVSSPWSRVALQPDVIDVRPEGSGLIR